MLCGLKQYCIVTDTFGQKKVKYPIPEIPDDSENKSGMDWVLPKIIGSGRVSGTRQSLMAEYNSDHYNDWVTFRP